MDAQQVTQDAGTATSPWAPSAEALGTPNAFDRFEIAARLSGKLVEPDLRHVFTPGLYTRTIIMPAATLVLSNIHKTEHPFLVSQGTVEVYEARNGEMVYLETLTAPHLGITRPGTQRALKNLTEVVWSTFHLTEGVDFDGIEITNPAEVAALVGARIEARITEPQTVRNPLMTPERLAEIDRFQTCLKAAEALVANRRAEAPEGCDPLNTSAATIAAYAAVASVVIAGVGAAVSYSAQESAAADQAHLALMNANANTQAIEQKGQLGQEQAMINQQLAANDQKAADANAASLEQQAGNIDTINKQNIEKSRTDFQRVMAAQRVQAAQGGVLDTTGSPYDNLLTTAGHEQQKADQMNYDAEVTRRQAYTAAQEATNQGIGAEISGLTQQSRGAAALGGAYQAEAQNQLNLFGQRAQAAAMQNQADGGLLTSIGNISQNGYKTYQSIPPGAQAGNLHTN